MLSVSEAQAALAEAQSALKEAQRTAETTEAAAVAAKAAWDAITAETPTEEAERLDARVRIADKIAAKAVEAVERAEVALKEAEREEVRARTRDADARASEHALLKALEPDFTRLIEIYDELCDIHTRIMGFLASQNEFALKSAQLRKQVPSGGYAPSALKFTLVRAVIGLRIYERVRASGRKFSLSQEPWSLVAPRWQRGVASPDNQEIERAHQLAFNDGRRVIGTNSFDRNRADVASFHNEADMVVPPFRFEVS